MHNYNKATTTTTVTTLVWSDRYTKERQAYEYKQRRDNRQTKRWCNR